MNEQLTIVGLGGSLRVASRSRAALEIALDGAADAGAETLLLDLRELDLPMFSPDDEPDPPDVVDRMIEACYTADAMLWSSPMYNGTLSGSFKNALDWLHVLGAREPAFLHDTVVGLISASGGLQGLQVINTMGFATRALRAWAVPYVVPVASAQQVFDDAGRVLDQTVDSQLRALGAEVVRVAHRFVHDPALHREAECGEAAERVAAAA
jgi:FMN reductase